MLEFYKGKKVLITGHTGFKGAWLSRIMIQSGADVTGYSLEPPTQPNLFTIARLEEDMRSIIGDIRDLTSLKRCMMESEADIVFHLAAQAIVRSSYVDPQCTFETNVMGTVNCLESIRACDTVKSAVIVTTDKVYDNKEWMWGYRESDRLDGFDPYSNSKSCAELVVHCYKRAFFETRELGLSTARAGNVIGGGDFAVDRIIPDCVLAALRNDKILIRNPGSVRPYQHVLEALGAYLLIAKAQFQERGTEGAYNVGPDEQDVVTTGELAQKFCEKWGEGLVWFSGTEKGPHEAHYLKLDCSKIKQVLNWQPQWTIDTALDKTIEWSKAYGCHADVIRIMNEQIDDYFRTL